MGTFLVTLHVIVVVLVVGPMVIAPFLAGRAIARRDAAATRAAGNAALAFGAGSLLAAILGALAVGAGGDRYDFGTAWVIMSMTVYVLVLLLAVGYTAPAARKAARLIHALPSDRLGAKPNTAAASAAARPAGPRDILSTKDDDSSAMEAGLRTHQRIDELVSRITGSGLLILLGVVLLVVLMVVKPFGG